jgi:hypothetical protein
MLSMLGALIVVVFSAWISGRWITAENAKAIAELEVRLMRELTDIKLRLQRLEDRAGIIHQR